MEATYVAFKFGPQQVIKIKYISDSTSLEERLHETASSLKNNRPIKAQFDTIEQLGLKGTSNII